MFSIVAEKLEKSDKTIRYIFRLRSIKFSDHVIYDIPVSTNMWSKEIKRSIENLPNISNPITNNLQKFMDPNNSDKEAFQASGSSGICSQLVAWNHREDLDFFKEHVIKRFGKISQKTTDMSKKMEKLRHLSINTVDPQEWLINAPQPNQNIYRVRNTTSAIRNFYANYLKKFLDMSDIVPDNFTYKNLLEVAKCRLKENWSQYNIQKLCCLIAGLDQEADFKETKKAIYDIKPELKGKLKKIEDLTDLDPETFTMDDFSSEEHEYHIINLTMNRICFESQFINAFFKTFKIESETLIPCPQEDYISGEANTLAFAGINYSGLYSGHDFTCFDYQVITDLALNNCWIVEHAKNSGDRPFSLYPCKLSSEIRSIVQTELSSENGFNQITELSEAKDISLIKKEKYKGNAMYSDVGRISALIGRELETVFPLKLSAEEIDIVVNTSSESKRWTICNNGKRNVQGERHRGRDPFITKEIPGKYQSQHKVVPSAEVNVDSAHTAIFEINYDPIFGSDMTVADMKSLIKSMGFSTVNGTKDDLKKRFAECMVKHYEKRKDQISEIFKDMKMICIIYDGSTTPYINGTLLTDTIDDYTKSKIVPNDVKRCENLVNMHNAYNKMLNCFLTCFVKTHNYADSIFSPDFENKMISTKGCMEDLILRSWGQNISIRLMETSGDF